MDEYKALGDAVFAALKPGGHALINVDAPIREWRAGFGTERGFHPWELMLDWAKRVGFRVPERLAFGRMGNPGAYRGRFRNDWEPLLWFQRPGEDGFFDRRHMATASRFRSIGENARSRKSDGSMYVRRMSGWAVSEGMMHQGTLWDYGNCGHGQTGAIDIEAADHPARWPYRLAEDIVRCFCPTGGLVCDPFLGAGTTAAAALATGRRAVGGDLYSRQTDGVPWIEVADQILRERLRQQALFPPGLEAPTGESRATKTKEQVCLF
jgi:hypothetical protein